MISFASPSGLLDWLIIALFGFSFLCLTCSWGHALLALRISDAPVAAKSRSNSDYLLEQTDEEALEQIINCYVSPMEELGQVIDEKARNLNLAYEELVYGAAATAIFILLALYKINIT